MEGQQTQALKWRLIGEAEQAERTAVAMETASPRSRSPELMKDSQEWPKAPSISGRGGFCCFRLASAMQGRRLRLLAVLILVCLLPLLSLIYTYRTFRPAVTRARRESASIAAAAADSRAVSSLSLDSTPDPVKVPETMSAKTAVENAIAQRKNRTVVFSKVRLVTSSSPASPG